MINKFKNISSLFLLLFPINFLGGDTTKNDPPLRRLEIRTTSPHGPIGDPVWQKCDVRILPWQRTYPQAIPPSRFPQYKQALLDAKRKFPKRPFPPLRIIHEIANKFALNPEQVKNGISNIC